MNKKDHGDLKKMLFRDYAAENPSEECLVAFYTGLTWFEAALNDENIDDSLNEFIPLRVENEYLRRDLEKLHNIEDEYLEMKRLYNGMKAKLANNMHLSNSELKEIKKEAEYNNLTSKIKELQVYKDLYYSLLVEKYEANK